MQSCGGPICPEAGQSAPRRAHLSRGGPICPQAGPSVPRPAQLSRGGPIFPEAGPSDLTTLVLFFFFFTRVTGPRRSLSLKLGGTRVYEPQNTTLVGEGLHEVDTRDAAVCVRTKREQLKTF